MSFTDLKLEKYTDHSVVVYGDTRKYKEDLKKLGGKYNGNLKNGAGWIFPKTSDGELKNFIKNGKRLVSEDEAKAGEERSKQRAKEWTNSRESNDYETKFKKVSPILDNSVTLSEYGTLINTLNTLTKKIDLLESGVRMLLNDNQRDALDSLMKTNPEKSVKITKKIVKKNMPTIISDSEDQGNTSEDEDVVIPRKRLMM